MQILPYGPKRYGISPKAEPSELEIKPSAYYSKGHALNPKQRDWTRYQTWNSPE